MISSWTSWWPHLLSWNYLGTETVPGLPAPTVKMHWIPGTVPGAWQQHLHWKHNSEWAYCWSPTKAGPDEQRQPFTPEVKLLLVSKRTWEQKSVERKKEKKKTCKIGWCRSWLPEDVRKKNILLQLTVRWTVIGSDPTLSALDSWRELKSNSWLREEQSLSHSFYFFSVCMCVDGGGSEIL